MVILNVMKNMLLKVSSDIGRSIYRSFLRIIGYVAIILIIGFCATRCTKAMTITDNLITISETQLNYFKDIYNRSNYKNYVITSYRTISGTTYTYYYLCLTNDNLDTSNATNITTNCGELYRYYSYSNNYSMTKLNDNELRLQNSVYYSSNVYTNNSIIIQLFYVIVIVFLIYLLFYILGCFL